MTSGSNQSRVGPDCPTSDEIAAFVDGDESNAIELHLDRCASCRRVLSAMVDEDENLASTVDGRGLLHRRADEVAFRYGRFELQRKLGQGAMGQVWAARDPQLGREVAIKVMARSVSSMGPAGTERMRREAQAMARLTHPNVVSIFELGTEDDQVFCAMELIDGVTWREWNTSPRPWRDTLEVGLALARGLEATHEAGLLHRDVKPDNVLIARDGRTLLTDFGLAKLVDVDVDPEQGPSAPRFAVDARLADLTATGALLGTPAYMAPEQLNGGALDTKSDQFSYCVTLFEALTGERPFPAETFGALREALETGARWPKGASAVPKGLRNIVLRGLSLDPAQRFPSMRALIEAIERASKARRARRNAALGVALTAALGTAVLAWPRDSQEQGPHRAARSKLQNAWNDKIRNEVRTAVLATGKGGAEAVADEVIANLDDYARQWLDARIDAWSAVHVSREQTEKFLALRMACYDRLALGLGALARLLVQTDESAQLERAVRATRQLPPVATCADSLLVGYGPMDGDPRIAELEAQLASVEANRLMGRSEEAIREALDVVAATDRLEVPALSARALFELAKNQGDSSRPAEAEASLRRVIQQAALAQDHVLVARTWYRIIQLLTQHLGRPEEALALEPVARAAIAQAGGDPVQYASLDLNLGQLQASLGNTAEAERLLEQARDAFLVARGPEHQSRLVVLNMLAGVLLPQGKFDEAEEALTEALSLGRKILDGRGLDFALILHNLSSLAKKREKWQEAEGFSSEAIEVGLAAAGPGSPHVATFRLLLSDALIGQGKLEAADEQLLLAEASKVQSYSNEHPDVALVLLRRAGLAEKRKAYPRAQQLASKALAIYRKNDSNKRQLAYALAELARMTTYTDAAASLPLYDEALELWTTFENREVSDDVDILDEVAQAALRAGKPNAALKWFEHLPEAASDLLERRRELQSAKRR